MQEQYFKNYSPILNRDMEHALIGHAGKLCLAFQPQNGHTWDFKNHVRRMCGNPVPHPAQS